MNKSISKKIANLNVILTGLIVILHSSFFAYSNVNSKLYEFYSYIHKFTMIFCELAVPCFFAISAYLFFQKFNLNTYKGKILSRIKSLVIPYFFWSILFLILFVIVDKINLLDLNKIAIGPIKYSFAGLTKAIVFSKYNNSLWYVRDLFILLVLFSPIVYFFSKNFEKYNIFIMIILMIYNCYFKISYFNVLYWTPIFYFVSYCTINKNSIYKYLKSNIYIIDIIYLLIFILYFIFFNNYYISYLYKMLSPLFVFSNVACYDFFSKLNFKTVKYCFLIYCIHLNLVTAFKNLLIMFVGNNTIVLIFSSVFVTVVSIFLIYICCKILNHFFPKFMRFISGNRT